jgi:hypothetical protein
MKRLVWAMLVSLPCLAQIHALKVYSEFTRIDPFGRIVTQDKGSTEPRHILSPGIPRNAFSSLRIVVTLDKPTKYVLDIGQNPENAVKATLYKERFEKVGNQWIPDGLEPVKIPYESTFPEASGIPGQTSVTFWLDMWVSGTAEVDRIKVEPQLWTDIENDWYTYPMEARILETVIPNLPVSNAALPDVRNRSDAAVLGPLRARLCGVPEAKGGTSATNARAFVRRNSLQYMALPRVAVMGQLLKVTRSPSTEAWCSSKAPDAFGPEWFLRFRDALGRAADGR